MLQTERTSLARQSEETGGRFPQVHTPARPRTNSTRYFMDQVRSHSTDASDILFLEHGERHRVYRQVPKARNTRRSDEAAGTDLRGTSVFRRRSRFGISEGLSPVHRHTSHRLGKVEPDGVGTRAIQTWRSRRFKGARCGSTCQKLTQTLA